MNCWECIGISPTADKKSIKRAYATQLKLHHPEDDPEGFKTLRSALEDALEQAKYLSASESFIPSGDAEEKPIHEKPDDEKTIKHNGDESISAELNAVDIDEPEKVFEKLQKKIIEIYSDFEQRIQLSVWEAALSEEQLVNLEVKQNTAYWLFGFIGHYPFIPETVFSYLDNRFYWYENYVSLKREFDEDFTNSVFDRFSRAKWSLGYQDITFSDATDTNTVESYLSKREQLEDLVIYQPANDSDELINELNMFKVKDFELDRLLFVYYQNQQNLPQALIYCEKLVTVYPDNVEGHLSKANIDYRKKQYGEAANGYKKVLAINENHGIALKGLAGCYFALNDLFSAKCLYEQALIEVPFDVEARIQLIQINQRLIEQNYKELAEQPNSAKASKQIAEGYLEIGAYTECIEFLEGIITKTKPRFESVSRLIKGSIVSVLIRWIFFSDIKQVFNYRSSELYHMLGLSYQATNQFEKIEVTYKTALRKAKDEGTNGYDSLVQLADFYIKHEAHQKAISLLNKARILTPDSARVFALLADAQRYLEMNDEAMSNINRAIALDNKQWTYYSIRSILLMSAQDYKAASSDLNKVLYAKPNFDQALYRQGVCHRHLGLYQEAMAFFKSAIDYNTEFQSSALEWLKLACEQADLANAELAMTAFINAGGALETVVDYKVAIENMHNQRSDAHE